MSRHPHFLRPTITAAQPRELICFDTETYENQLDAHTTEHVLEFGWAAYCCRRHKQPWHPPNWFRFDSALAFWSWCEERASNKMRTYIYCHNANFDWQVTSMCTLLPSLGWVCRTAILNDPPNWFVWRKGAKTLYLLDTFNYWTKPLADIAKRVGLEKYDMPANWRDKETSDRYCRRDVEILLVALQEWYEWIATNQLGSVAISLAGQAWQAYKHRFMDHPIFIDQNVRALSLARTAYYGGRTEAWRIGVAQPNQVCVDVNSMYPYVMRTNLYPTKIVGTYRRVSVSELAKWLEAHCCVADVTLTTNENIYPFKHQDKLLFPVGTFRTHLTTPELSCALNHSHIQQIHEVAVYECAHLFTRFIDTLHALRLECANNNDEAGYFFIKILMNSLYGKFGQRTGYEEVVGECAPELLSVEQVYDLDTGLRYQRRYIAGKILERGAEGEARESHPAIAAHVTAYARLHLWSLIQTVGPANITYMDTDSLIIPRAVVDLLATHIHDTRLGALKIEKEIANALFYGPKDYILDGVRTIKGVRRKAIKVGPNTYYQARWGSLKSATRAAHNGGPLVTLSRKHLKRQYNKGIVEPSGRVRPFNLPADRGWLRD